MIQYATNNSFNLVHKHDTAAFSWFQFGPQDVTVSHTLNLVFQKKAKRNTAVLTSGKVTNQTNGKQNQINIWEFVFSVQVEDYQKISM